MFVSPRNWSGKGKWAKGKEALGEWKSVRAYDASDLEQWLEHSLQAQGWMAEQLRRAASGVQSLDEHWYRWASVTNPELPRELFRLSIHRHADEFGRWLKAEPSTPLVVAADSRAEALAFLYCLFESEALAAYRDKPLVFTTAEAVRKLVPYASNLVGVFVGDEAERELGGDHRRIHAILLRPRNTVDPKPDIELDLLNSDTFSKALTAMGITDDDRVRTLARESGMSPTVLRRRMSTNPGIQRPQWAQDYQNIRALIPLMLVGGWHSRSAADREVLRFLSNSEESETERQVAAFLRFDDPPLWSAGHVRGIVSKIDAFFAVHAAITVDDINSFLWVAELVLSESDPALDLPPDKRWAAGMYGKTRQHSRVLREGICETLVLLSVHGNDLFGRQLGMDVDGLVGEVIRRLLTPLTVERLLSQSDDLPAYAEAAPDTFLRLVEADLKSAEPQVYELMKPADRGVFGGCARSGLLWALECLAWNRKYLMRVSKIFAMLSERKIEDNWQNKPENSLLDIYRGWMPQTAASLKDRIEALEALTMAYPRAGWHICINEINPHETIGRHTYRPRWRNDAAGAGRPVTNREYFEFGRKAFDLAMSWPDHDETTLGELVSCLQGFSQEYQYKVWDLIEAWARATDLEERKADLRERIRRYAFTRRANDKGVTEESRDRAREVSALLAPPDPVLRHGWLFLQNWIESSAEDIEDGDVDFEKREEIIRQQRVAALQEIWECVGFAAIVRLLKNSQAPGTVGWNLADGVINTAAAGDFLIQCFAPSPDEQLSLKLDGVAHGFLHKMSTPDRTASIDFLLTKLDEQGIVRLLKASPFGRETWLRVDAQPKTIQERYWSEVQPGWIPRGSTDINEFVDRFLNAKRPRAAFTGAHFLLEDVETSRLKRLMHDMATCDSEPHGTYRIDSHYVSTALDILEKRADVTSDDMAQLEFLFIKALSHSKHGIPNLARQITSSPSLFIQALAAVYKRSDGGKDPEEWSIEDTDRARAIGDAAWTLMDRTRRVPGTDDKTGNIDMKELRRWLAETRGLCAKYGRVRIGDQKIGEMLTVRTLGKDGIWPCEPIREILEEIGSEDVAQGMRIGVYNSRGVHSRNPEEGGIQERDLAKKYRNWSEELVFRFPFVARMLMEIADQYDHEAVREDWETQARRRLLD